ncbi:MAG: hypothetical protein ACRDRK_05795 [Pseudonocardia sp.]
MWGALTDPGKLREWDWMPKVAAGWHQCLTVAEYLLDGRPIGPVVGENARNHGWDQLHDAYADALGIRGTGWPGNGSSERTTPRVS